MNRQQLLESISGTISDYRAGEIDPIDPPHVERWIKQFDVSVQEPMLRELNHVFKRSYLSRASFLNFLRGLVALKRLPGLRFFWRNIWMALAHLLRIDKRSNHTIWKDVKFLDIQKHGASQREMLKLFGQVLSEDYGLTLSECESTRGPYVYLDDFLFTGNRVILDLRHWIQTEAPSRACVVVVVMACYRRGLLYSQKTLLQTAAQARKSIRLHWLRSMEFEDRPWLSGAMDGFHPTHVPDNPLTRMYVEAMARVGYSPRFRVPGRDGDSRFFSSESGRQLLEQQHLLAGLKILSFCRNPQEVMRPLGYHTLKGFGFGATVVTYRNCPNNCPLAWWWGDPDAPSSHPLSRWYPLFSRKV